MRAQQWKSEDGHGWAGDRCRIVTAAKLQRCLNVHPGQACYFKLGHWLGRKNLMETYTLAYVK